MGRGREQEETGMKARLFQMDLALQIWIWAWNHVSDKTILNFKKESLKIKQINLAVYWDSSLTT